MKDSASHLSRSEKRVLWEVRQRYKLNKTRPRPMESGTKQAAAAPRPTARRTGVRPKPAHSSHWGRRIALLVFLGVVIAGGIFGYKILAAGNKISTADSTLFGQIKDLLFSSGEFLEGEQEGRINVLFIAIGGQGHQGQNLADSIIVASIRPKDGDVAMLSIPRDLYVQVPNEEYFTKINAVHAHGESQRKNGGPELLQQKIEEVTGQPIHYYARVDFTAFKSIVDAIGGVNITIENSFTDYWHKISFPAGTEKMNGERALAYVRARYVEGSEGGDFKRAARQQQVLLAIREKVFSVNTALDFKAVNDILNSLSSNIRTDMQLWEMRRFFELARTLNPNEVHSVVLSTGHNGVLVGGTEVLGGVPASILRTRTGDYSEIQAIATSIFSEQVSTSIAPTPQGDTETTESQASTASPSPEPSETPEIAKPSVEVRNGTNITGLAKKTSDTLQSEGYNITGIGNAANRTTATTTVYAIEAANADGAKSVADLLGATTDSGLPTGEANTSADVLVILGTDAE